MESVTGSGIARRQNSTRPLQVGGSIDTERNSVNDGHIDTHAIFESA